MYFFPPEGCNADVLRRAEQTSFCEWKGEARYFDVVAGERVAAGAAFAYPRPSKRFRDYAGWVSFYAGPMDACFVGDDRVTPQAGGFYSGWITPDVVGPFKGIEGSWGW